MSIQDRPVSWPPQESWLSFDPINSDDIAEVAELSHAEMSRLGPSCTVTEEFISTASTTLTDQRANGDSLAELEGGSGFVLRQLDADHALELVFWAREIEVEWTVLRRNADGSTTVIGLDNEQQLASDWTKTRVAVSLAAADVVDAGEPAPLTFSFQHRHLPDSLEFGDWYAPHITAAWVTPDQLP